MDKKKKTTRSLTIRIPVDLYRKMRHISVEKEKSLNKFVIEAFEKIVEESEKEEIINEKIQHN